MSYLCQPSACRNAPSIWYAGSNSDISLYIRAPALRVLFFNTYDKTKPTTNQRRKT
nr:MAG TPA: hypothetical protein [Caudoviricetes sp.]